MQQDIITNDQRKGWGVPRILINAEWRRNSHVFFVLPELSNVTLTPEFRSSSYRHLHTVVNKPQMTTVADETFDKDDSDVPDLQELWCFGDDDGTGAEPYCCCCTCGKPIAGQGEAIIRTFSVRPLDDADGESIWSVEEKEGASKHVRALGSLISIYNRHLACLQQGSVTYVTVSHVWDLDVSAAQARGRHSPQDIATRQKAFARPINIYRALVSNLQKTKGETDGGGAFEVWHDYISVLQWRDDIKEKMLGAIPKIYGGSHFTLAFLEDVTPQMVEDMRHAPSSERRLAGVTGVCNAQWFARVWTAMEFVRSARLKPMVSDYTIYDDAPGMFLGKAADVYEEEIRLQGDILEVERMAQQGRRLVPWNVVTIADARRDKVLDYAPAFSVLSARGCRSDRDFFHALRGIVLGKHDEPLKADSQAACLQVAMRCLEAGDYSPLLITPRLGAADPRKDRSWVERMGYNDVISWGLRGRLSRPECHDSFYFAGNQPVLKLERIGIVRTVRRFLHPDQHANFANIARTVVDYTGPDVDAFVETLGTRLYDQDKSDIMRRLAQENRRQALEIALREQYDVAHRHWPMEGFKGSKWVADAMGLSNASLEHRKGQTPFEYLERHGRTIHLLHRQAIIGVACQTCHDTFLFRAALYQCPTEVRDAVAYRIPGLHYKMARPDGVGILVKNEKIVGRMIWACPACPCQQREMVKLSIPDLPLPVPRAQILSSSN
ncbi:hypothetical protein DBV05_g4027 [Lasiodiplodia theobromae]|uniref:Heterokaryon incompatibility domain-containing protein n=1 Tax=Lasiodiplodia theobromae TaxID=45133 RepID=A0A5N5DHX6_9PEZI|nr:hypothetical protein DBV05_g4027 [Lasiodiplodia theobromae]